MFVTDEPGTIPWKVESQVIESSCKSYYARVRC
jgi:hypothetical protein